MDEYGNQTGEYRITYAEPKPLMVNVSAARGTIDVDQFGSNANYSRTIVTDDVECPIDANSILWIGIPVTKPHNYVVVSVARSINSVTYAIREVMVG